MRFLSVLCPTISIYFGVRTCDMIIASCDMTQECVQHNAGTRCFHFHISPPRAPNPPLYLLPPSCSSSTFTQSMPPLAKLRARQFFPHSHASAAETSLVCGSRGVVRGGGLHPRVQVRKMPGSVYVGVRGRGRGRGREDEEERMREGVCKWVLSLHS